MCGRVMVDMFGNRSSRRSAQFMEMKASRTQGITNGNRTNASKSPHGVVPLDIFVPVEHPSEPLDVDQPMQCPRPEPGIMHDGRIWKERILAARARRRAELLGDLGNESVSWDDVPSVVVACIEGHSTPNISFEVYNNKNKYAPEEDLKKLHSLEPDEPRGNDTEVTGMLLR